MNTKSNDNYPMAWICIAAIICICVLCITMILCGNTVEWEKCDIAYSLSSVTIVAMIVLIFLVIFRNSDRKTAKEKDLEKKISELRDKINNIAFEEKRSDEEYFKATDAAKLEDKISSLENKCADLMDRVPFFPKGSDITVKW